ncbi:RsmB/NOP family class I SAM-dependent RNA methyltransferase [Cellvibrio sp. OA-2007]|uniref:RsmB/NOP family class I SAM-dependent RNA methyltransferase n=1 Tax=Cellvibrio sp. OA-2007 TaxID=529823 RepID=UPI000785BEEC|nr:RsmB/NOP family class I SAM-dependent RNA methyltransferase [Cellvibrio sp. OA-2007]
MQSPVQTSSNTLTAAQYEDSRLVPLWRSWCEVAGSIPLDKWLKNSVRQFAHSGPTSMPEYDEIKKHNKFKAAKTAETYARAEAADTAALSLAMFSALRFQQLATALEFAYRNQAEPIDWLQWDLEWQHRDAQGIAPIALWYWIQLRVTGSHAKKNQAQLRDSEERREFFDQFIQQATMANMPVFLLWYGLRPQWQELLIARQRKSEWSEQLLQQFIEQQVTTPPLWLRVQKNADPEQVLEALQRQGVKASRDDKGQLFAQGGAGVHGTDEHKNGLVEIQDIASQQIALSVAAKPGQKVWDACAGAGGKTLAIAAQMNNKGAVVATDLHEYKLDELKRRVKRADIFNVRAFTWTGLEPLRLPKEIAQQRGFDWVLIDAPCSSAGTWRRNPDARWRFDANDTQELIQLQQQLLTNAAPAVRAGGHLVYATCSWQVSENEQQIEWFLRQHPEFSLQSQRILGVPELNSDTMFVAVLARENP